MATQLCTDPATAAVSSGQGAISSAAAQLCPGTATAAAAPSLGQAGQKQPSMVQAPQQQLQPSFSFVFRDPLFFLGKLFSYFLTFILFKLFLVPIVVPIDTIYLVIIIEVYFNLTSFRYIFIIILLKSNCPCPNNLPLPDEGRAIPLRKKKRNTIKCNEKKTLQEQFDGREPSEIDNSPTDDQCIKEAQERECIKFRVL